MKKRLISMGLALAMVVTMATGCGKEKAYDPNLPTECEEADILVQAIDGLSDDFIKGVDVSEVLVLENAGVKYYNDEGEEEDVFKILADSGVNYVRVRVWNDPYDSEGHGYGGGNCDVNTAAEIGKRAKEYGIKLLVDFHYSDFWADPNKQMAPKAWEDMTVDEKVDAIYDYTVESLNTIIDAGGDLAMVQIGNEINNGMAGETTVTNTMALLTSASKAVRAVASDKEQDIQIAVHYTQVDDADGTIEKAYNLDKYGVDYDIFGISYYPYWHGTIENMQNVLSEIAETYNKKTCIMETSYVYTTEDGDQNGNTVSAEDCWEDYPVSVEGQAMFLRDLMAAASEIDCMGVFYWGGIWVPVGSDYSSNQKSWEEEGTGWATSYAGEYDPDDAGQYYGGCAWDNQALFDFEGKELASLDVFKYVNYGSTSELKILGYREVNLTVDIKSELVMPETVEAIYNDPTVTDGVPVTWDADDVAKVDTSKAAVYTVSGTTEDGTEIEATIKVESYNYIQNNSFETGKQDPWTVSYPNGIACTDVQNKSGDAKTGDYSYHFWTDQGEVEFNLEQTISASELRESVYTATCYMQGGDIGLDYEIYLYVKVGDQEYQSENIKLNGWLGWKTPTITDIPIDGTEDVTVGVYIRCKSGGWGTIADVEFFAQE